MIKNEKLKISEKSFIGLFWFNKDYTDIHETIELKSFDEDDIRQSKNIAPDSDHAHYIPIPTYLPRGRVMLIGGQLVMYVGLKCPDSSINMILKYMGLLIYKDKIIIHRDSHWDMKNDNTIVDSEDKIVKHIGQDNNEEAFKQEYNWKRNIDEEINFREIKAGKIPPGTLYRSSNPLKGGDLKKAKGLLAVKAGIRCILNLEDNDSAIKVLSKEVPWYHKLVIEGNVIGLKMYLTIPSVDFNKKFKKGLQFLIAHKGPYLIHCFAGIDRAGFVIAVLQALMGASMEEICNDYLLSFGTVNASTNLLLKQLAEINHGKHVYNKDLQINAMNYLSKDLGFAKDEIMRLIDVLGGKF